MAAEPAAKDWSFSVTYEDEHGDPTNMYPDFLVIRRVGEGFVIDVIEPHRADEGDAPRKVKALAEYAEKHGTLFGSVQVISKGEDGVFRRLDLNRDTVRAAAKAAPHNVVQLFVDHGEAIGTLA